MQKYPIHPFLPHTKIVAYPNVWVKNMSNSDISELAFHKVTKTLLIVGGFQSIILHQRSQNRWAHFGKYWHNNIV